MLDLRPKIILTVVSEVVVFLRNTAQMRMKNTSCALSTHSSTQQYRYLLVIYFYAPAKDVGWRNNAFSLFVSMLVCPSSTSMKCRKEQIYLPPPRTQTLFICRSCCAQGLHFIFLYIEVRGHILFLFSSPLLVIFILSVYLFIIASRLSEKIENLLTFVCPKEKKG